MALAWRICLAKDWATVRWGEIGPRLVTQVVREKELQDFVRPPKDFCSIGPLEWRGLIDRQPPSLPPEAYGLHFWNEMWRRAAQDKNADYPPECLYEYLKRRHLYRTDTGGGAAVVHGAESRGDILG